MKKIFLTLTCMTISLSIYAGTPSATDSTTTSFTSPVYYMNKYLNIDQRTISSAGAVVVTQYNTFSWSSCPTGSVTTSSGVVLQNVQYFVGGIFGDVPEMTRLNTDNYERWTGSSYITIGYHWCNGGPCANPYWVYDFSALQLICVPVYSDWQATHV